MVRRNAPLVCSSGKTPLTSYHVALFFATLTLLLSSYVGISLLTGGLLRLGDVLRLVATQMLMFIVEDSAFFFITPYKVENHFGGLAQWLTRFGISYAVGFALLLLAMLRSKAPRPRRLRAWAPSPAAGCCWPSSRGSPSTTS